MWLVGPCLVDMKWTYVVFQPAGWHWRWEKTVLQGKCRPWRKPARTYMAQCIDKSLVDGADMEVCNASLFQSPSLWWEGLKSSKQDRPGAAWGKPNDTLTDTLRGQKVNHLWIELNSWRCNNLHCIYIWSSLTCLACLLRTRGWGLIAVLRWDFGLKMDDTEIDSCHWRLQNILEPPVMNEESDAHFSHRKPSCTKVERMTTNLYSFPTPHLG